MQHRKFVLGLLTVCIVSTMALPVHAEDTRVSLDGGNGSWHGGITDDNTVCYSKIWDHVVNHEAFKATVWVQDALGSKTQKTGQTTGINADGEVKVTCKPQFSYFNKNKSGYKDLTIVDLNARQAYRMDMTAPSSFEAEFEFSNPAEKK